MPITRRKRANPPDQPENNSHQPADQNEGAVEQPLHPEPAPASPFAESAEPAGNSESPSPETFANAGMPQPQEMPTPQEAPAPQELVQAPLAVPPPVASSNGDRSGPDYTPGIEGSRRTSRGELFRRPPQAPPPQASFVASTPLQAPTVIGPARTTRQALKGAGAPHEVSFSVVHLRHRRRRLLSSHPLHCRHQPTRLACLWAICCTWPITLAIQGQRKLAASCFIGSAKRAKPVAARAAGTAVPWPSHMTAGIPVAALLAKSALPSAKSAASGA